ncbi:MAG TPA: hypothetical protein VIL20_06380 [Sandaracinaceae bacterium]
MSAARSPYIVGPRYDWAFFLAPPLVAMLVGLAISGTSFATDPVDEDGSSASSILIGILIHAHLVAVFVRSHGNAEVRRRHPVRFFVVPLLLFFAIVLSDVIAVACTIVATFWDVWHSGAQTFGFARIYDRNAGGPSGEGRTLDFWLNQLLYAGPILAGATLMEHLVVLEEVEVFDGALSDFLVLVPAEVEGHASTLTWIVVIGGALFLVYYVLEQRRRVRAGRRISPLKIYLLASTAFCSIVTWGFNPWGEAFFIMNAFHAVQYLALVWAVEGRRITAALRLSRVPFGRGLALACFLGAVFLYGCAAELADPEIETFWALTIVVSLMHFWYDAFLWSVRKNQV